MDLLSRTLVLDSRLAESVTAGLDFYGNTMTLFSTNQGFPATYIINPGATDTALQASFADDTRQAEVNAQWLQRVPIGPRNPNIGQVPSLPFDLKPEHVFQNPTVFTQYRHYQRLIPSVVNFEGGGSAGVVNVQEWHFLRNGRVLIRFTQHVAGGGFPNVIPKVIEVWAAYRVEPKPPFQDILHLYADNSIRIETDAGEQLEWTLEDGRRHLFWGKDRAALEEWAALEQPVGCEPPANFDPNLVNTGLSLQTSLPPDDPTEGMRVSLTRALAGSLTIQGDLGCRHSGNGAGYKPHISGPVATCADQCRPRWALPLS